RPDPLQASPSGAEEACAKANSLRRQDARVDCPPPRKIAQEVTLKGLVSGAGAGSAGLSSASSGGAFGDATRPPSQRQDRPPRSRAEPQPPKERGKPASGLPDYH
ncbi:MAG TPA: hypothetical protein VKP30_14760, partial [Polyangiaceae bacterium]|nr:hypothetical protein [Polyangiaceae bacterium]